MKKTNHPVNKRRLLRVAAASLAIIALGAGGYWVVKNNLLHADWWGPATGMDAPSGPGGGSATNGTYGGGDTTTTTTTTTVAPAATLETSTNVVGGEKTSSSAPVTNADGTTTTSNIMDGSTATYDPATGKTVTVWPSGTRQTVSADGSGIIVYGSGVTPGATTQTLGAGGVVLTQDNPDGSHMVFKKDAYGSYSVTTWPDGVTLTSSPSNDGSGTATFKDGTTQNLGPNGVVLSQTNPDNSIQTYDPTGKTVISVKDAPGNVITYGSNGKDAVTYYDAKSQTTVTYGPDGKPTGAKNSFGQSVPVPASAPASGLGLGNPAAKKTAPSAPAVASISAGAGANAPVVAPAVGTFFGLQLPTYIRNLYDWALVIGAGLAVVMIMWAGYTYITSMGDPEGIRSAKDYLVGAILGLALLVLTATIARTLGVQSVDSATVPIILLSLVE